MMWCGVFMRWCVYDVAVVYVWCVHEVLCVRSGVYGVFMTWCVYDIWCDSVRVCL